LGTPAERVVTSHRQSAAVAPSIYQRFSNAATPSGAEASPRVSEDLFAASLKPIKKNLLFVLLAYCCDPS
jgi:hypothetical protein